MLPVFVRHNLRNLIELDFKIIFLPYETLCQFNKKKEEEFIMKKEK